MEVVMLSMDTSKALDFLAKKISHERFSPNEIAVTIGGGIIIAMMFFLR